VKRSVFAAVFGLVWFCLVSGCSQEKTSTTGPEQTYSLHGYVRHSITNDKVPDVIVEAAGLVCTTNSVGYYYFNDISSGNCHLTARKGGDILYEANVPVDGPVQHDFQVYYVISLYGWVRHPVDGPVAGAEIRAGNLLDTTSVTGYYEFILFVPGQITLTCSKDGFQSFASDISMTEEFTRTDIEFTRLHYRVHGLVSH
jgi:hypothetical protein